MTLASILKRIRAIDRLTQANDQHDLEDMLYKDVLRAIANHQISMENAAPMAKAALEAEKLDFPRWTC